MSLREYGIMQSVINKNQFLSVIIESAKGFMILLKLDLLGSTLIQFHSLVAIPTRNKTA